MDSKEFPTLEDVHVILSDLTNLFEDRNAMLHTMMKEDKYKDFLLAENIQSMVEADNRDDSRKGGIRQDLANGYEILKAQTTMRKFANFINPASMPIMDLDAPIELYDDRDEQVEEEPEVIQGEDGEKGEKGDKGDPGQPGKDNSKVSSSSNNGNQNLTSNKSQTPDTKLAKGGYVPGSTGSPLFNSLQPSGKNNTGSITPLEDLGLDGDANVASEFVDDLGLDKYKSALAAAMGLPLKAVAAGLSGLLSALNMPDSPEFANAKQQISNITESFNLPKPKTVGESSETNSYNKNRKEQLIAGGGLFSTISNMFGLAKNKDHQVSDETPFGAAITGIQNRRQQNDSLVKMLEGGTGGPSLESGNDKIYASANTHYDQTKTAITNVAESAKSIFKSTTAHRVINKTASILNQILGGTYKADIGAQTNEQDINSLTNQVIELNEVSMSEMNNMVVADSMTQNDEAAINAKIRALSTTTAMGLAVTADDKGIIAPTELEVSRFLMNNIVTIEGGQTAHDVV